MSGRRSALLVTVLLLAGGAHAASAAETHNVQIRAATFLPSEVRAARGDTIRWTAVDEGHTVTADDERFDFFKSRTIDQGQQVQWTAPDRDMTVGYYCRVHGGPGGLGMAGVIVVGRGGPRPSPPRAGPQRTVPSTAFPTIARGVAGAGPGTVVTVLPGVYRESVVIVQRDITVRGGGRTAGDVVLDGTLTRDAGLTVSAAGVQVSNLTVRRYRTAGLLFRGAHKFSAVGVQARESDLYGIRVEGSTGGVIDRAYITGAVGAGISVSSCPDCGLVVRRIGADDNAAAVVVDGSSGVVIRDSLLRRNATGVVLKTLPGGPVTSGVHIYGNTLVDNAVGKVRVLPPSDALDLPAGVGVWVAGATRVRIERNHLSGHVYGIALTALGAPAAFNRILHNVVSRSAVADLAWDGVGVGSCFAENTSAEGWAATIDPPYVGSAYSCHLPETVGVPHPRVLAELTAHAFRRHYCRFVAPALCAP